MAVEDDVLKSLLRIERTLGTFGRLATRTNQRDARMDSRVFRATAVALDSLSDSSTKLGKNFDGLSRTVRSTRDNFIRLNRSIRDRDRAGLPQRLQPQPPGAPGGSVADFFNNLFGRTSKLNDNLRSLSTTVNVSAVALGSLAKEIFNAVGPFVDGMLQLEASGISSSNALVQMSADALMAGMSLSEYTDLIRESSPAVTRATSMKAFNATLEASRQDLKGLGIFGKDAMELAATMATSATVLGVPQAQLSDVMVKQVDIFRQLGDASLLTAAEFKAMTAELADNQEVQSELLALDRDQRGARFNELLQIKGLGLSMGATKKASDALAAAIIDQRKMTAQEAFQVAGGTRVAGQFLNMDPDDLEKLARARMSAKPTAEESEIIARVGSEFTERMERLRGGNIQERNIADQIQKMMGPGMAAMTAAGNIALTAQSGEAKVNADFAKGTSDLVKGAGDIRTLFEGYEKSPFAKAIMGVFGSAAFTLGIGTAVSTALGAGVGSFMGGAAGAGGTTGAVRALGTAATAVGSVAATGLPAIINAASALTDLTQAQKDKEEGKEGAQEAEGAAIGQAAGGAIGAAVGIFLSGFIGAFTGGLGLLATGLITTVTTGLGAFLGKWVGGWLTVETAVEKQARETKKNTEALSKQTEAVMASTGVLNTTENLGKQAINQAQTIVNKKEAEVRAEATKAENVRAEAATAAPAAIATPTEAVRPTVTVPAVNTPAPGTPVPGAAPIPGLPPGTDLSAQLGSLSSLLQQILDIEKQSLGIEREHADSTEALFRAANRRIFNDNEAMVNKSVLI